MKKQKQKRSLPEISTASLPDIIFMLLFFFMVVTVMRKDSPLIQTTVPETDYVTKIDPKQEKLNIHVGLSLDGTKELLQINNKIAKPNTIRQLFQQYASNKSSSELENIHVDLKVDAKVKMKLINALKLELRRAGITHLNYVLKKKALPS